MNWSYSVFFQLTRSSLHRKTKEFLASIKATVHSFVFLSHVFYLTLTASFLRWVNLTGLLEFHIAISEILLTGFADQILYNLSLIKLWSSCAKQNAAVKATSDAC